VATESRISVHSVKPKLKTTMERSFTINSFWDAVSEDAEARLHEGQEDSHSEVLKDRCHCRKSACRSLYCACRKAGRLCTSLCRCVGCKNCDETKWERVRNDGYRVVVAGSCHCKKSRCLKKYCVCFEAGVSCTSQCRCTDCQNTDDV